MRALDPLQVCKETGHGPTGTSLAPSDAVHGVFREKAWDAGRKAQAFERSATEGKAEIQTGVLVLYDLQPV